MDYLFETLGPERFQHFCQALLLAEKRDIVCFPVGQPDGGRDAAEYHWRLSKRPFVVYQVKYVRQDSAERNTEKWLEDIVANELPKIRTLAQKGATGYYLLTNVRGTGHADVGSIDRMKEFLDRELPIEAHCWWRDDLSRRLDTHVALKWSYPDLLTGSQFLEAALATLASPDRERRTKAIRAFLSDQFSNDYEVRFKQIELANHLLDLFIDVPISQHSTHPKVEQEHMFGYAYRRLVGHQGASTRRWNAVVDGETVAVEEQEDASVGTASFLLDHVVQTHLPLVVLEGAPGQGKSTITQYVCQVHRMRLLGKGRELERIPESHSKSGTRLPLRVDLRDFAIWLGRKDPFVAASADSAPPQQWHKSLESFLAALVRHHSGGFDFTVSDLHAVFAESPIFLALDGLDEVAEIERRKEVVDEIVRGISRLNQTGVNTQAIVTSRPAAFANSPGLPRATFSYLQLTAVNKALIDEYAERWLNARRVAGRERDEFKAIIDEKLQQSHLRDLARNPMQLAILLSLIHTKGSSLPDKRTALYDSYVELFFSRESAKSTVVRENRDLLVDIHRFLGWHLHSAAERGDNRGAISQAALLQILEDYLLGQGFPAEKAATLFSGVVERVVALVSRIEGTYEFEVQPLREYFAARYLYETAPYSPPGREQTGTKPDRFDAIARNPYWLNVTRFYAGCFSKGELAGLVERIRELYSDTVFGRLTHPGTIASALLTDWVFTQSPRSVQVVVDLMLQDSSFRTLLAHGSRGAHSSITLPDQCGRSELVQKSMAKLSANPPLDQRNELTEVLRGNSNHVELRHAWQGISDRLTPSDRTRWITIARALGLLQRMTPQEVSLLMRDEPTEPARIRDLFFAGQNDYLHQNRDVLLKARELILDHSLSSGMRSNCYLETLAEVHELKRYGYAFTARNNVPLAEVTARRFGLNASLNLLTEDQYVAKADLDGINALVEIVKRETALPSGQWATDLQPWEKVIEASRELFDTRPAHVALATLAAGILSKDWNCNDHGDLLDSSANLTRRARYARLRAGSPAWWRKTLVRGSDTSDGTLGLLVFTRWASLQTQIECTEEFEAGLNGLRDSEWLFLITSANRVAGYTPSRYSPAVLSTIALPDKLDARTVVALGVGKGQVFESRLYVRYLTNYSGSDRAILEFCQRAALQSLSQQPADWRRWLRTIRTSYLSGARSVMALHRVAIRRSLLVPEAAARILDDAEAYPSELVVLAESTHRQVMLSRLPSVGSVAERDGWFNN